MERTRDTPIPMKRRRSSKDPAWSRPPLLSLAPALLAAACASTGATLGSGVGDAFLEHPPYYAGAKATPGAEAGVRVGHLPIAYQRGASQDPVFDPPATGAVAELLARMNHYLDSLEVTERLVEGGRVSAVSHQATLVPPDVQFGCITESGDPEGECALDEESALGRGDQRMRLATGRPSPEWTAWMARVMHDTGVERTLVVTLEVSQYLTRQRGWRGTKEVELGTGHVERLPWLTSLETPVSVVQLTGALVGRDGKAIRIGAEGLMARRTPMRVSAFGAQALITDEDVVRLMTERREHLPGRPLAWQAGLRELVARLTAQGTLTVE